MGVGGGEKKEETEETRRKMGYGGGNEIGGWHGENGVKERVFTRTIGLSFRVSGVRLKLDENRNEWFIILYIRVYMIYRLSTYYLPLIDIVQATFPSLH